MASSTSIVELQNIPPSPTGSDPENLRTVIDPLSLSSSIKSEEEISTLTARHRKNASRWPYQSGRLLGRGAITIADPQAPKIPKVKQKIDVQGIKEFYQNQNESIQLLLKPVEDHVREAKEEQGDTRVRYLIAVNGSFACNIILAILQLYGAIASGSLSLFATMADAIFDPMSNLVLIVSHRAINKVDANRFPSGKARLETAANIVFCFLMISVSFILIVMSARDIATNNGAADEVNDFHLPSIIAVGVAFTTKLCLFFYCWSLRNVYSQVRILWEDHRNDLLINGFGLLTSVGGSKLRWWIDPAGAIVLSILILVLWGKTAYKEFLLLIGLTADSSMLRLITYISMTHSEHITQIDTVRAYHSGPRIIVEVDIVMCPSASLRMTHDIAEELQIKIESLPDVERAYVHVDYETSHKPEHFLKKEL